MSAIIILVRHAATTGGEGRAIGRTPLALSALGQQQATALADSLRSVSFSRIYTSPALRAHATLAPLLKRTQQTVLTMPELDEIDLGDWDGLPFTEIQQRFPDSYAERGSNLARFRPPRGNGYAESFADVAKRMQHALAAIASEPLPALVMTHAGCIRSVLCHCTGTPLDDLFRFSPAHIQQWVFTVTNNTLTLASPLPAPAT